MLSNPVNQERAAFIRKSVSSSTCLIILVLSFPIQVSKRGIAHSLYLIFIKSFLTNNFPQPIKHSVKLLILTAELAESTKYHLKQVFGTNVLDRARVLIFSSLKAVSYTELKQWIYTLPSKTIDSELFSGKLRPNCSSHNCSRWIIFASQDSIPIIQAFLTLDFWDMRSNIQLRAIFPYPFESKQHDSISNRNSLYTTTGSFAQQLFSF